MKTLRYCLYQAVFFAVVFAFFWCIRGHGHSIYVPWD